VLPPACSGSGFAYFPMGLSNPTQIHCEMEWKERREEAYAIFPFLCPPSFFYVLIGPSSLHPTPTPSHYQPSSISKEAFLFFDSAPTVFQFNFF
jgi:hypothetical protein